MHAGLTLLETYLSELDAEFALRHLKALGVRAIVEKDNCGGLQPQLDLRGIKLLVADADLEKARAVLAEAAVPVDAPAWTCSDCGQEVEAGFGTCWQCGHDRD